jgi:chromosome segregation ATPase
VDTDASPTALLRRIEELAARAAADEQPPPEGPVLAAALTGLRAELGGLRADLGTLRADLSAVRSGVEASTGKLTGALAAARAETEDLGRRHDDLRSRLDAVTEAVGDIKGLLPELRAALARQPDQVAAVQVAVGRLDEALANRIETLAGDLRRTLSAGLTQATAGSRAAEAAWTQVRSETDERLAALEDTLDGLAERLEATTRDSFTNTDERLDRVEERLRHLVGTALPETVDAQAQWADEVRDALGEVASAVDRSLGSLGTSLTDAVRMSREDERSHVNTLVAGLSDALGEAVAGLEQRLALTRDATMAADADLRGFLESFQASTVERLDDVRGALAGGLAEARAGLVEELRSTLEALETANAGSRRVVEDEVVALRGDLADALEEVRDRIATTVTRADDDITAALDQQRSVFDETMRTLRSDVLDRVEQSTATVQTGLDELRNGVVTAAQSGEDTRSSVRTFAEILAQMYETVSEMNADWDRRTDATIDLVTKAGQATVADFRAEMQDLVARLSGSVDATTGAVGGSVEMVTVATQRLVTAGQALLGYLARRDQLLEAERDRVLHELLDEFARGLSAKERRGMGERVTEVLERRRDARDADRYRRTTAGEEPVEIPEVPDDLARLAAPVPAPKPPRKAPAEKAAAKAATRKAPAKKAAKKAATKKVPAKKAPADKVSARRPSATKQAPAAAGGQPEAPPAGPGQGESAAANTTEPLDGEGTTRV